MRAYLETRRYNKEFPLHTSIVKDNNYLAHWHIDVEMLYVFEGSIRISVNDETRILNKDDFAIFGSTDIHRYDSTDLHSTIIFIVFQPDIIGKPAGWPESAFCNPVFYQGELLDRLDPEIRKKIPQLFRDVLAEYSKKEPFYREYIRGRLIEFFALINRHFLSANPIPTRKNIRLPDIAKVKKAMEFIDSSYMNDLSLEKISELVDLSPCYFSRLFKKYSGANFHSYLAQMRSDIAEKLIRTTQMSMTEIAYDCGFGSVRTFNRVFKAMKGYAPSKIRLDKAHETI